MKKTEIILEISSRLLGIAGAILAFIGVTFQHLFPWVTFQVQPFPSPPATKSWQWLYYQISPFLLRYQLEGDIPHETWFYKADATLIGVICLIGAMIGLIGVLMKKRTISFIGGIIVMSSLITFGTCLPGLYPLIAWGFGAKITFYGSFAILTSAIIGYLKDNLQKNRVLLKRLLESWQNPRRNEKKVLA